MEYKKKFCAHRGISGLMPDNTLPSFAAAIALGADEIEFDVRETVDHKLIVSHEINIEGISDGKGTVHENTFDTLRTLNCGKREGWQVGFCTMEEILDQFAHKVRFNFHMKEAGEDGWILKYARDLIVKYGIEEDSYFAGSPNELAWMMKVTPEIPRWGVQSRGANMDIRDMVVKYDCVGAQFWNKFFEDAHADFMKEHGYRMSMFFADNFEDMTKYFDMGIETIITNRMDIAAQYRKLYM